jgi:hypothetical protein
MAADPEAALLALAGEEKTAIMRPGNRSSPKKRRKKSAAWKMMIALAGKARWGKGK